MIGPSRIPFALALVACLSVFFSCQEQPAGAGTAATTPATATAASAGLSIVFIQTDSLQTGYTVVADELARLEENFTQAQANHQKRVEELQREVGRLQNQVQQGLLAPNKIQSEQQRIGRKEQEIMQQRDIALGSIQEDQIALQQQFSERLKVVLEELRDENGYDYILNQGPGSGVLITNDAYDITPLVLERLNAAVDTVQ